MKNEWGDEIDGPAVNDWGDPIEQQDPTQEMTLAKAAFPGAHQSYAPREASIPSFGGMQIPGQQIPRRMISETEQQMATVPFDALSLPKRAVGAVAGALGYEGATGGKQGLEALADPETGLMRPVRQQLEQRMADQKAEYDRKGQTALGKAGNVAKYRLAQAENLLASGVEDPLSWIPGVGGATLESERIMKPVTKLAELPNKAAGKLAQELSNVSEEALRMAGTKEGRAALQANSGKEYEIGQKLVGMLDNPSEYAPNKIKIDKALKGMGNIDLSPVIKALQEAKVSRASGITFEHERAANAAIQKDINDLLGVNGRKVLPASEFRDIRIAMDEVIDHSGNQKQLAIVNQAKLKARKVMRDLLENKAKETGNPEYIQSMSSLHKQLDARDRLSAFLGKNKEAREDRAESFIANMWGKNKKNRQRVMSDMEEAFGKSFVEDSKLANLAAQLGEEGKAGFYSRSSTGRSKLGGTLAFPFASPMFASRVTLPLATLPAKSLDMLKRMAGARSTGEAAFYADKLKKSGMDESQIQESIQAIKTAEPSAPSPKPQQAAEAILPGRSPAESRQRNHDATRYLTATNGKPPDRSEVYKFVQELGDKDVPKAPEKPKVTRDFNGRRSTQEINGLDNLLANGDKDWPTKKIPIKDAPETFTIGGMELKKTKGAYGNGIYYKDKQGRVRTFRGDETIHIDIPKDEIPF